MNKTHLPIQLIFSTFCSVSRSYIVEQYKEFYANDVCKSHPDVCEWVKERILENTRWIEGKF